MATIFHKMNKFPDYEKGETFSKTVIVYDEKGEYAALGYYDYEACEWVVFDDFSTRLSCWCEIPDARHFATTQMHPKIVKHRGYQD